jgi:flagellar hook-length control protein FliK
MAVIPPDAGIRLRTQTDSGPLNALAPVRGVPSSLPEFQIGQAFTARIQEVLPDNTYKALVAGRQLTLQLPEGANPGDTLELTVIDRSAKMLVTQRTEGQTTPALDTRPYQYTRISDTGRLIGQLLPQEGETPQPAALSRGQPLVAQPPSSSADLAPSLQKAVTQSGLFYEAHQAQWVAGDRPLASLRAEPQGQLPVMPKHTSAAGSGNQTAESQATTGTRPESAVQLRQAPSEQAGSASFQASAERGAVGTSAQSGSNTSAVPDGIRPLVQQQLDAVATQRLAWSGEVWPGQSMDWSIERELIEEREASTEPGDLQQWSTSLRLTMPRLGIVGATLQLSGDRLRLRLTTDDANAASDLRQQAPELTQALANAGLTLQVIDIRNESEG